MEIKTKNYWKWNEENPIKIRRKKRLIIIIIIDKMGICFVLSYLTFVQQQQQQQQ